MSEQSFNLEELGQAVVKILNVRQTEAVRIKDGKLLKDWNRNYVAKFQLEDGPVMSVVVKQAKRKEETWYAEWAGLNFLTELAPALFCPRLLGYSQHSNILVMQDLGVGQSCEDFLNGNDALLARQALLKQAKLTAQMHRASLNYEDKYNIIRRKLEPSAEPVRVQQAEAFLKWLPAIEKVLSPFGLVVPTLEYRQVASFVSDPDSLLVFTHGDMAPTNNHIGVAGPKLLDFEYGGFRHAFYDVISWQIICPYPPTLIEEMNQVYRQELGASIAQVADDAIFRQHLLALCAFDLFRTLRTALASALQMSEQWATNFSNRQAIIYKLGIFSQQAQKWGYFKGLGLLSSELQLLLMQHWGIAANNVLNWPAFR